MFDIIIEIVFLKLNAKKINYKKIFKFDVYRTEQPGLRKNTT